MVGSQLLDSKSIIRTWKTDNPTTPLATSKAGCIINPTDEPEPP